MKIGAFKLLDRTSLGLSIVNLYIIKELVLPFLFGMGIFTSLGLSIGAVFELIRKVTDSGLFWGVAAKVLILRMPEFIVLAFPMSMLLATLMTYSRLSSDSELIALRSIGISIYRLIVPAIAFSLFIVTITFLFNNFVAPAANYEASVTLREALGQTRPDFKTENILFDEYTEIPIAGSEDDTREILTRLFYAEEFDGEQMKNLTVLDRSRESISQIVTARSAKWNVKENIWDFYDGTIYLIGIDGGYNNVVRFQHQQLALPQTALEVTKKGKGSDEMNFFEAREYLKIVKRGGDEQRTRKWQYRIQEKVAIPFACLVFAIIGAALGVKPQNSAKATSFGICIGLIFAYYLLSFICQSLGISGVVPPAIAAWIPNVLGLGAASGLLAQSAD